MTITEKLRRVPVVIAHRGDHREYPENTLKAFEMALQAGVCIELDVCFTRDDEAVIIHEETFGEVTDLAAQFPELAGRRVEALESETIRSLKAIHPRTHRQEPVPIFEALLLLLKHHGGCADIEIKRSSAHADGWVVEHVLEPVMRFGLGQQVLISSFHHPYIALVKQTHPELFTAALFDALPDDAVKAVKMLEADACFAEASSIERVTIERLHQAGIITGAYTVNDPKHKDRLVTMGVEIIFTDDIGKVQP
jgi:glycerophosphoryl diester phosphodiesterase